ncbi:MAG: hypothetical protein WCA07_03900 [Gloeobacterales cyanobacterium]
MMLSLSLVIQPISIFIQPVYAQTEEAVETSQAFSEMSQTITGGSDAGIGNLVSSSLGSRGGDISGLLSNLLGGSAAGLGGIMDSISGLFGSGDSGFLDIFFDVFKSLTDSFDLVQGFVSGNVNQVFGTFAPVIEKVLGKAKPGVLGVYNPNEARKALRNEVTSENASQGDAFEVDPGNRARASGNELDRQITRGGVDSYLGEEGQKLVEKEIKDTDKTINKSTEAAKAADAAASMVATLAKTASKKDVTQDVMKIIAAQNAATAQQTAKISAQLSLEAQIMGVSRTDALKARADAQLANTNLTNISETLDQMQKRENAELLGKTSRNAALAKQASLY